MELARSLALGRGELHLATRSEPTVDKPGVALVPPDPAAATVHGEVVLHVHDCRAMHAQLTAKGASFLAPPTVPPWGTRSGRSCAIPTAT